VRETAPSEERNAYSEGLLAEGGSYIAGVKGVVFVGAAEDVSVPGAIQRQQQTTFENRYLETIFGWKAVVLS